MKPTRKCSIDGCERELLSRGWCSMHYQRWRKHGTPSGGGPLAWRYPTPEESFKARTRWDGDCLIWIGSADHDGYGTLALGNRRGTRAHRYAWERVNGPIPNGIEVDHTCFNPPCCNIDHLRLVTKTENRRSLSGPQAGSSSGVRNVHKYRTKWRVSIRKDGKLHNFGIYRTVEEAAAVAEIARRELFGEFAGKG